MRLRTACKSSSVLNRFSLITQPLLFRLLQELMAKAGVPATVQFSNNTKQQDKENGSIMKEKDLPDWAFLHLNPHADKERYKRRLPISNDGKTINKRLLSSKMGVIKYCMPYGKSIDWVQQSDVDKLVALRAFDHSQQSLVQDLNGVGDDICNLRA